VPSLAVGASDTGPATVTVPARTKPGDYHVLACADDLTAVGEFDETNNCTASAGTVTIRVADLRTSKLTPPPASGTLGGTFPIKVTSVNAGTLTADASVSRVTLSSDQVPSVDDVAVLDFGVASLAPGAHVVANLDVPIPLDLEPGTYYVIACADATEAVDEASETNNCRASSTTITIS
jgi:subtilase family serine protease